MSSADTSRRTSAGYSITEEERRQSAHELKKLSDKELFGLPKKTEEETEIPDSPKSPKITEKPEPEFPFSEQVKDESNNSGSESTKDTADSAKDKENQEEESDKKLDEKNKSLSE